MTSSLLLDDEPRHRLWQLMVDFIDEYPRSVDRRPVAPRLDPEAIRTFLEPFTFESPEPPVAVFERVAAALAEHQVHTPHPCYFGLFNPAPSTMGIAADALVAALNPQLAAWSHSPLAVEIERHLVRAFGQRFGYEAAGADGTFTTGGAEANATALLCALAWRWPEARENGIRALPGDPLLYLSGEAHHSLAKAARAAGLGEKAVRRVPVTNGLSMDLEKLRDMLASDRRRGCIPFLVVGTAGATGTGSIDPLPQIADIAQSEGLWFHVDAAWAGAAQLVPEWKHLLTGIERADSITFDSHKWLSVPMGAGLFLTRHPDALARTFALEANYMPREGRGLAPVDPFSHSIQWSRRFSGLKLFLTLAAAGWDGYTKVLAHQVELGALLRRRLANAGWRLVNDTPLPIVCFTSSDEPWPLEKHQAVADAVIRSGRAWISTIVTGKGQPALRACVTNYRTAPEHIDVLIDALEEARGLERRLVV